MIFFLLASATLHSIDNMQLHRHLALLLSTEIHVLLFAQIFVIISHFSYISALRNCVIMFYKDWPPPCQHNNNDNSNIFAHFAHGNTGRLGTKYRIRARTTSPSTSMCSNEAEWTSNGRYANRTLQHKVFPTFANTVHSFSIYIPPTVESYRAPKNLIQNLEHPVDAMQHIYNYSGIYKLHMNVKEISNNARPSPAFCRNLCKCI